MTKQVWREIVEVHKRYHQGGPLFGGSYYLILSCGHSEARKMSQGIPKRNKVACRWCNELRNKKYGGPLTTRYWENEVKLIKTEYWNHEIDGLVVETEPAYD